MINVDVSRHSWARARFLQQHEKRALVSNTVVRIMWFLLIAINIDLNCHLPGAKVRLLWELYWCILLQTGTRYTDLYKMKILGFCLGLYTVTSLICKDLYFVTTTNYEQTWCLASTSKNLPSCPFIMINSTSTRLG